MRTEFGFQRTRCDCPNCSINCRFIPGYLIPADVERIQKHLGEASIHTFAEKYLLASPGATVMAHGQKIQIPTLVPARKPGEHGCIFRKDNGHCEIHEVSPFGCAFFDAHQPDHVANHKSLTGLVEIHEDHKREGTYSLLWFYLHSKGKVAPAPSECRRRLSEAYRKEGL